MLQIAFVAVLVFLGVRKLPLAVVGALSLLGLGWKTLTRL